uniref:Uncharacterized protein n=1 Tax=Arundo donax TaxID=35708 RepID=A0A0A9HR72_ARUDO
MIGEGSISS